MKIIYERLKITASTSLIPAHDHETDETYIQTLNYFSISPDLLWSKLQRADNHCLELKWTITLSWHNMTFRLKLILAINIAHKFVQRVHSFANRVEVMQLKLSRVWKLPYCYNEQNSIQATLAHFYPLIMSDSRSEFHCYMATSKNQPATLLQSSLRSPKLRPDDGLYYQTWRQNGCSLEIKCMHLSVIEYYTFRYSFFPSFNRKGPNVRLRNTILQFFIDALVTCVLAGLNRRWSVISNYLYGVNEADQSNIFFIMNKARNSTKDKLRLFK